MRKRLQNGAVYVAALIFGVLLAKEWFDVRAAQRIALTGDAKTGPEYDLGLKPVEVGRSYVGTFTNTKVQPPIRLPFRMRITALNQAQVTVEAVVNNGKPDVWTGTYDPNTRMLSLKAEPADFFELQYSNGGNWTGLERLVKGHLPNGQRDYGLFPVRLAARPTAGAESALQAPAAAPPPPLSQLPPQSAESVVNKPPVTPAPPLPSQPPQQSAETSIVQAPLAAPRPVFPQSGPVSVNLSPLVNKDLGDYDARLFPRKGGPLTVAGVRFTLATNGSKHTAMIQSPVEPWTYSIPVNLKGVSTVYTLINSAYGACGTAVGELDFAGTASTPFVYPLTEGVNVRDYRRGNYCNAVTEIAGSAAFGNGVVRFDMQRISLPASFATDTLVSIQFKTYGKGVAGAPFLTAITAIRP